MPSLRRMPATRDGCGRSLTRPRRSRPPIATPRSRGSAGDPGQLGCHPKSCARAEWRRSLAPAEVWERFDDAIESLSRARTGVSVVAIAQAFGQLSSAAWELAEAVERAQRQRTSRAG